ncbi:MAG TPA: WecB/TagA/CpsF family glycosyltransferase [Prolixibacteraceae bacterium]|nr:WecB/TagA/CpsF family glycosyltransferase [Prolixibacteraceae bacterium]
MQKYFKIFIEFNHQIFDSIIEKAIKDKNKGYVCVIDGNVLAHSTKNTFYGDIVNGALVNSCDGSSIAMLLGYIHKQKFSTYTGPEIFSKYIKTPYKQYFLGNTEENLERLKKRFIELGYDIAQFKFDPLPFKNVDDFDYRSIAKEINEFSPDIIWVSLGAPKQEIFISKLYPFINRGVLFAIGAAFNLFLGDEANKRAPEILQKLHLEWLFRVYKEPNRVGGRAFNYFKLLPRLIIEERKQFKSSKQNLR